MLLPLRSNLFDKLLAVYAIRKTTGGGRMATTLSAAVAAGATTMPLTSAADAVDRDIMLVGSGDDWEALVVNGAPSGNNATVFLGAKKAHEALEAVTEGVAYDLGDVAQMKLMDSAERADITTDTSRSPSGSRLGFVSFGIGGRLRSLDVYHMALALGLPFSAITGAATQADPTQLFTDGDDLGREPTWFVAATLDEAGNVIYQELDACDVDYSRISVPLSQGPDTGLDISAYARMHIRQVKGAINFNADVTKRITKSHNPESLLDAGYFELLAGGLNTTLTAATVVDASTLALTAATGVAAGKYYLVEGGGKSQIVWVESLAALNATLRTRTKYVFPVASTVKEIQIVRPGGLKEGSTQFQVGGGVRPVRFDNSRVEAGKRAGTARFSLSFAPTSFTLETLRRRLGLPAGAVVSNVLTSSDLVGTDAPVGCFAKVQRKDGKLQWIIINTVENTLESLELALSQSDMLSVPLTHIAKQVQLLQY